LSEVTADVLASTAKSLQQRQKFKKDTEKQERTGHFHSDAV
jgi:hypothetical protein